MIRKFLLRVCIVGVACLSACQTAFSQDSLVQASDRPIVLRNLEVIRNKSVAKFDEHRVELSDRSYLGWDRILKATVGSDQQAEFDLKIHEIGLPLFRLKLRIANGDWSGAGEIAKLRYRSTLGLSTNPAELESNYLVCLAMMKSHLHDGHAELSLAPFLQAAKLQQLLSESALSIVGAAQLPKRDCQRMFSSEITPIWFDRTKLENVSKEVELLLDSFTRLNSIPPGVRVYLASLKLVQDSENDQGLKQAADLLRSLGDDLDPELDAWKALLEATLKQKLGSPASAQQVFDKRSKALGGATRAAAFYLYGSNATRLADFTDLDLAKASLSLLKVPAIYGDQFPHLSSAAIYQAASVANLRGRKDESQKLINELLRRYPRTYHGRLVLNKRMGLEGPDFE